MTPLNIMASRHIDCLSNPVVSLHKRPVMRKSCPYYGLIIYLFPLLDGLNDCNFQHTLGNALTTFNTTNNALCFNTDMLIAVQMCYERDCNLECGFGSLQLLGCLQLLAYQLILAENCRFEAFRPVMLLWGIDRDTLKRNLLITIL